MQTALERFQSCEGARCERLAFALLADGLSVEIRVTGSSMWPFIRPGDLVVLDPLGTNAVRVGDVLGFLRGPGRLAIHRVVAARGGAWMLRGDGARADDGWVEPAAIVGRVRTVKREGSPVRLGLGPERLLIALLSRAGGLALWSMTHARFSTSPEGLEHAEGRGLRPEVQLVRGDGPDEGAAHRESLSSSLRVEPRDAHGEQELP